MLKSILNSKAWKLCCSLKLTIVLASAATLVTIGGSLLIPFKPKVFSGMDGMTLGLWVEKVASQSLGLTWWVPVAGVFVGLLGINTVCCFTDWIFHFRARWRKCGEYLIHIGFVLVVVAYAWGSLSGFRSENNAMLVGQSKRLPQLGVTLKLEAFKPVMAPGGRPMEMLNTLALYRGDELLKRVETRSNHPLTWGGLVAIPVSYGQTVRQGRYAPYSILTINYDPGAKLAFAGSIAMSCGVFLTLFSFYRKRKQGDHPDII